MSDYHYFELAGYRDLIRMARERSYEIIPVKEAHRYGDDDRLLMMMRHDVDFSLREALRLAEAESEEGIVSTYLIQIQCDHYSLETEASVNQVIAIRKLGHEIGLHYDTTRYAGVEAAEAKRLFLRDKQRLEELVGYEILTASQHNPVDSGIFRVGNLVEYDVYNPFFREERFTYISDSCAAWRQYHPVQLIEKNVSIHFLTHPIWWTIPGQDLAEKLHIWGERENHPVEKVDKIITICQEGIANRAIQDPRFMNELKESEKFLS